MSITLSDLVDLLQIQSLSEAHYKAAGMPIGIIDAKTGAILVEVGWQDICTRFHRAHPVSEKRCQESDCYIKTRILEGKPTAYKCRNGLWDIGIPILVDGHHLATLFLGQFFYEGEMPDRDFFIRQAEQFEYDVPAYLAALDNVPAFSRERVNDILDYNVAFANFIADLAHKKQLLNRELEERKRMEEEIKHQAHHDALTGLPNRRLFMDILDLELTKARRSHREFAVLFLDLDRFKYINDTLGHDIGDELLKIVAGRVKSSIRSSDIVSRMGGDEFNILLTDISHAEDISTIARKIIDSFREPFAIKGHGLHISTSIGVSIFPDDGESMDALFRNADIAMYHAKELGGNTCQFYDSAMNIRTIERMHLESWLRQSLNFGELEVFYQPQITTDTRRVVCAEALVRWRHPERGLLAPKHFIPLAEETGFISVIDEWVLRTACAQLKEWHEAGMPPLCVTVNLSAKQFRKADLVERVSQILNETGLDPKHLDLEITESVAMRDLEHAIPTITRLSEMGVGIAIDDFGTGYSSLNYLKRLPIQKLKIDQSFVQDIATDPDDRTIVKAVTSLAQDMKLRVIAEGVETEEQLEFLKSIGCREMQGFLFSKPLPAEEFREFVASGR